MLTELTSDQLLKLAIAVVRSLLPAWEDAYPSDRRPKRAVEAAEEWLLQKEPGFVAHAKIMAKECTKARRTTMGSMHRTTEAARALAQAAAANSEQERIRKVSEALEAAEEEQRYQLSVKAVYGQEREIRRIFIEAAGALLPTDAYNI